MSGLKLENVRKSYGRLEVIKGVNLEIVPKAFVVFVGPSGCGKSTLLRMIAGLEDITSGDLFIGGKRMNGIDPSKRGIAMVFQTYALYPHMTAGENMGFALKFAGVRKEEIQRQVNEAARILELENLLNRRPKELSGGQRQRVAIGRAIVRHPEVFLFDEPLSNLDAELRVQMRIEIARLHKELQSTIVYVTHDQVEAMTLADQIVVIRDGAIEQTGPPLQLYDDPNNRFVAGFIGSPKMNFIQALVAGRKLILPDHESQSIDMPRLKQKLSDGQQVSLGIRPEQFASGGDAYLDLTIEIVENLGGETFAYARKGKSDVLTIATGGARNLSPGERMKAHFDPAALLLFDTDGERIR
jgi:lactose/L-arabinose transport system ATP-binding protein